MVCIDVNVQCYKHTEPQPVDGPAVGVREQDIPAAAAESAGDGPCRSFGVWPAHLQDSHRPI